MSWWEASEEILRGISRAVNIIDPSQVETLLDALMHVKGMEGRPSSVVQGGSDSLGRPSRCA